MYMNQNMVRRLSAAALAGTMLLSLSACGSKQGGASSDASSASGSASGSSASASSSQTDDTTRQADQLSAILVDIKGNVEVGSAGSSLKAVPFSAALLSWASSSTLSQEEITAVVTEMLSTVSGDEGAAAEFTEQLSLVNADCQTLLSDDAQELLDDAGCTDVDTAWSEQTAGVLSMVMAAAGVEG